MHDCENAWVKDPENPQLVPKSSTCSIPQVTLTLDNVVSTSDYTARMLMVIFGAGASYDSSPDLSAAAASGRPTERLAPARTALTSGAGLAPGSTLGGICPRRVANLRKFLIFGVTKNNGGVPLSYSRQL